MACLINGDLIVVGQDVRIEREMSRRSPPAQVGGARARGLAISVTALSMVVAYGVAVADDTRRSNTGRFEATRLAQANAPQGDERVMVPPVSRERPQTPSEEPAAAPVNSGQTGDQIGGLDGGLGGGPPPGYGGIIGAIQDWLARANRDYQGVVIKELSIPAPNGRSADDAIAKKLEETKAEDARAAAAKRAEDEARKLSETKRREDERREAAAKAAAEALREKQRAAAAKAAAAKAAAANAAPAAPEETTEATTDPNGSSGSDESQLAEQQRREQLRAEEARRIADAQRAADARVAEQRRQAEAARAKLDAPVENRRTVRIIAEPIPDLDRNRSGDRSPTLGDMRTTATSSPDDDIWRSAPRRAKGQRQIEAAFAHRRDIWRTRRGTAVKTWSRQITSRRSRAYSCRHAGRRIDPPGRYIVRRGDSLWRISKRHYRTGAKYTRIYRANRRLIRNPNRIYPCQRVMVPRRRG